jgi:hypothetical protein
MQENVGIIILTFNALQKWHVTYLKLAMLSIQSGRGVKPRLKGYEKEVCEQQCRGKALF